MTLPRIAAVAMIAIITAAAATALGCNPGPNQGDPKSHVEAHPDLIGRNGVPLLTEFGDFNCPHCIGFATETLPQLKRDLINPGIIGYRYRHYPFLDETSLQAAFGAECAREQNKFQDWHDIIYQSALTRAAEGTRLTSQDLNAAAFATQVDAQIFRECLNSGVGTAQVEHDRRIANAAGVRGTPTLFLDGVPITWRDYEDLHTQLIKATED